MTKALTKRPRGSVADGLVPAVASGFFPGVGQLLNGEVDKAIGVGVVAIVAGASWWAGIPLIGGLAGLVYGATWVYGVADGYLTGRKKG